MNCRRDSERDAYRGGNSNNDAQCGAFYLNLNNTASNANWNIGASQSYPIHNDMNALRLPLHLEKIDSFGRLKKYVCIYQIRENRRAKELCGTNVKMAV